MSDTELAETPKPAEQQRSALAGAVDWGLAAKTGTRLVPRGPLTSRYTAEQAVAELTEASVRAEGPVREVTGLADGLPIPAAQILDRPGWVHAAARSMAALTAGGLDAGEPSEQKSKFALAGKAGGLQAGAMLAFVSTAILGQYDPFTGDDGSLLLVAPNIVSVERTLKVNPSDFRLWVCLHEVTHRVQFSSSPWLAGYMQQAVGDLSAVTEESMTEVLSRLNEALRERRRQPPDPGQGGLLGVLRATQPPAQRDALDRLLMLGTLLEGHADHVMDAVGPAVVPTVVQIRSSFEARRTRSVNPLQKLIRALLGIDAKMAQYVRGKAFVDHVVGRVGMAEFNTIWTGAETLPLTSEIDEPDQWIARVLG
ncbi:zinc-dependent metalloprotease [Aldersonia sp. NBC_00410]|uniref:zinc-dependent metalloprotease n=1 Tax=Aldersonia sp. NBC_00410 TaxID=2975954 RepID=UPI00224E5BC6|nr:zinc-dependent metalloprotease [Aldersonia sp. NBC_00410]MCX5043211.1 zinc-dependent metalloprotease [Aldersonia sp. NBC_00410]